MILAEAGTRRPTRSSTSGRPTSSATRALFWGTPDFALPSLRALLGDGVEGIEVAGVVTRPPRPRGRGRKKGRSPVAEFAASAGLAVLEPEKPSAPAFVRAVEELAPDLSVVVAYGRILSRRMLDAPRLGSINLHPSLLPALRGAAPIPWAIARGLPETGVTVMRMVEEMDAGPVLAQERVAIGDEETASELAERLAAAGARLLVRTVERIGAGRTAETEQDHGAATFAPPLTRESARVDWTREAKDVANLVRAMDAAPGAWTLASGLPVKMFRAKAEAGGGEPGCVVCTDPRRGLVVAAGAGVVRVGEVQPPGKRRMPAGAWVAGRHVREGDRFE